MNEGVEDIYMPLLPAEHHLNSTAYLSIAADRAHPFMITVYHLLMAPCSWITHRVSTLRWSPPSTGEEKLTAQEDANVNDVYISVNFNTRVHSFAMDNINKQ